VLRLAEENGLELWVAFGKIDLGSADAELGNAQQGIEQMEQVLAAYEATGGQLWLPYFLGLLADALAKAGRVQEGLAAIAKALSIADLNSDAYAMPELHRIEGELILKSADLARVNDLQNDPAANSDKLSYALIQAQACFAKALITAKRQQTRSWELRAHLSMDRLAQRQGQPMHAQLAESYSSFSEGFETADLKQARTRVDTASRPWS
jgi:predicted ATPase